MGEAQGISSPPLLTAPEPLRPPPPSVRGPTRGSYSQISGSRSNHLHVALARDYWPRSSLGGSLQNVPTAAAVACAGRRRRPPLRGRIVRSHPPSPASIPAPTLASNTHHPPPTGGSPQAAVSGNHIQVRFHMQRCTHGYVLSIFTLNFCSEGPQNHELG